MHDLKWSESEKKIARRVFQAALEQELGDIMGRFKEQAARVAQPEDMWALEGWLAQQRREVEAKYDFRYSQLVMVFGRLLREGRVARAHFDGLGRDKLSSIEHIATL